MMQLVSVNVGVERPIQNAKPSGRTGIYKQPASGAVTVTTLGLQGDVISDTEHHGGRDQALYVFTTNDYAWWSDHIGQQLGPGTFGDNLTISNLESAILNVGDRLRVGGVLIEVTAPRIPCVTIAARMQDPQFVKKFRRAEKPGAYCRVIETGSVRAGDPVEMIPVQGEQVSIIEFMRIYYEKNPAEDELRRLMRTPIPEKARAYYEKTLAGEPGGQL